MVTPPQIRLVRKSVVRLAEGDVLDLRQLRRPHVTVVRLGARFELFGQLCASAKLAVLRRAHELFRFDVSDVRASNHRALVGACSTTHMPTVLWLLDTFDVVAGDVTARFAHVHATEPSAAQLAQHWAQARETASPEPA